AAGDLAQDDPAPALGEVLAEEAERLLDLPLARLAGLGQVAGADRLRREEEQRLDRACEVAHASASRLILIGPKASLCSQLASPVLYMSSRANRVTAWVSLSSPPNSSSKSMLPCRRSASRRARRRFSSETVGRMWSRLS